MSFGPKQLAADLVSRMMRNKAEFDIALANANSREITTLPFGYFDSGNKPLIALYKPNSMEVESFYSGVHHHRRGASEPKLATNFPCALQLSPSTLMDAAAPTLSAWYLLSAGMFFAAAGYPSVVLLPFTGADAATEATFFLLYCAKYPEEAALLKNFILSGSLKSQSGAVTEEAAVSEQRRVFKGLLEQAITFSNTETGSLPPLSSNSDYEKWLSVNLTLINNFFKETLFSPEFRFDANQTGRLERLLYYLMRQWKARYEAIESDWLRRTIPFRGEKASAAQSASSAGPAPQEVALSLPETYASMTTQGLLEAGFCLMRLTQLRRESTESTVDIGMLVSQLQPEPYVLLVPWGSALSPGDGDRLSAIMHTCILSHNKDKRYATSIDVCAKRILGKLRGENDDAAFLLEPERDALTILLPEQIVHLGSRIYQELETAWQLFQAMKGNCSAPDSLLEVFRECRDISDIKQSLKKTNIVFAQDVFYNGTNPFQTFLLLRFLVYFRTLTDDQKKSENKIKNAGRAPCDVGLFSNSMQRPDPLDTTIADLNAVYGTKKTGRARANSI